MNSKPLHIKTGTCIQQSQQINSLFLTTNSQQNEAPLSICALKDYQPKNEAQEKVLVSICKKNVGI